MALTFCPGCRTPSARYVSNLPCRDCLDSLVVAPAICRICLSLACSPSECQRPWMRVAGEDDELLLESLHAVYLSIGPGAGVLKSWKKTSSPALDAFLRLQVRKALESLPKKLRPRLLLPVPQSPERKWFLNGGSTLRFSEMISTGYREQTSVLELLALDPSLSIGETNQARTKGDGRYSRRAGVRTKTRAEIATEPGLEKRVSALAGEDPDIFLVDDFLTSGATLRASLKAARDGFESLGLFAGRRTRIHAFVLGFRPSLFD